jgi:hypothetical protein
MQPNVCQHSLFYSRYTCILRKPAAQCGLHRNRDGNGALAAEVSHSTSNLLLSPARCLIRGAGAHNALCSMKESQMTRATHAWLQKQLSHVHLHPLHAYLTF